ncbi:hypothetical protein HDU97_005708 [Phlyctochytrium planicorne]|nr:hypothetical protein HDU97_005708 [Phlyctochytrium planicorne]
MEGELPSENPSPTPSPSNDDAPAAVEPQNLAQTYDDRPMLKSGHCMHGKKSRNCRECKLLGIGGADLCDQHLKFKYLCFQCFDEGNKPTSICEHRQNRTQCNICHPQYRKKVREDRHAKAALKKAAKLASASGPSTSTASPYASGPWNPTPEVVVPKRRGRPPKIKVVGSTTKCITEDCKSMRMMKDGVELSLCQECNDVRVRDQRLRDRKEPDANFGIEGAVDDNPGEPWLPAGITKADLTTPSNATPMDIDEDSLPAASTAVESSPKPPETEKAIGQTEKVAETKDDAAKDLPNPFRGEHLTFNFKKGQPEPHWEYILKSIFPESFLKEKEKENEETTIPPQEISRSDPEQPHPPVIPKSKRPRLENLKPAVLLEPIFDLYLPPHYEGRTFAYSV